MSLTPYPTFHSTHTPSLGVVNRARFHPATLPRTTTGGSTAGGDIPIFASIISKSRDICTAADKKQSKKCQKAATSLACKYITDALKVDPSLINVEIVITAQDVLDTDGYLVNCLLDAGADKVVLDAGCDVLEDTVLTALERCRVPSERVLVTFASAESLLGHHERVSPYASTIGVTCVDEGAIKQARDALDTETSLVVSMSRASFSTTEEMAKVVKSVSSKTGCRVTLTDPKAEEMGMAYVACLKSDREDGLFTTVVVTRCGEALGLVYSSHESIIHSLSSPRAIYHSRSRASLWRKGDTSGHYQLLHRIDVDCDGDALLFTVTQCGEPTPAFCHLLTLSCWGETRGLRGLEQTLKERLRDAPEGSYTRRLFGDEELLRDKLVEEAMELSEAKDRQHVAEELADVIYFAMVKAVKAGVGMDDAVRELDKRARKVTRRKGDSKVSRIEEGKKILDRVCKH
mmetsp:Transcript_30869/g.37692  ORF Transcript_30869/g.37692 Transcript_30869/m.37692 type:complete len:460 (+) Transcript_30869:103-1482(+)|eukprot:CAMPEP_0172518044 /NCGR_PEP_ID=MMETSP1066-20121228/290077_1 /TAXON_ID=671091 /ORGANISM="Coscinodiscus wailesii, Strain CCMP2513" /LENGTH=459 /DNA_ID=CAMNT_0013300329 /DNA_START=91 /DNA_END=1470 /DNA_ORIENTATION=+